MIKLLRGLFKFDSLIFVAFLFCHKNRIRTKIKKNTGVMPFDEKILLYILKMKKAKLYMIKAQ